MGARSALNVGKVSLHDGLQEAFFVPGGVPVCVKVDESQRCLLLRLGNFNGGDRCPFVVWDCCSNGLW